MIFYGGGPMCTVTFIPKRHGCIVAMNRDDLRTRVQALPPELRCTGEFESVYPMEPGGGTWCGANNRGLIFTLLNWHVAQGNKARTRGEVIPALLACPTLDGAQRKLQDMQLTGMLPFRLFGFSGPEKLIREWRWNNAQIVHASHPWKIGHWFSSGMSDECAENTRRPVCDFAALDEDVGSIEWVRKLHKSHQPERGAFSICVHRPDAATLSYTEILCTRRSLTMRYVPGNPCERNLMVMRTVMNRP